jgi:hypothetical protein
MFEDPEGFQQNLTSSVQGQILNATLNLSEEMVRQAAGDELVNAAQEWGKTAFQNDPGLFQKFIAQRNPYGFLVQQYQREQSLTKLGDDPKKSTPIWPGNRRRGDPTRGSGRTPEPAPVHRVRTLRWRMRSMSRSDPEWRSTMHIR